MEKIVILGAGVGGVVVANLLAEHLRPALLSGQISLEVITDSARQVYKPGFLYLAFGSDAPGHYQRDVHSLLSPLVRLEVDPVSKVETSSGEVHTRSGRRHPYDQLIIATGARVVPAATPGLEAGGHHFYTQEAALALRQALGRLESGKIVLSVAGIPHMCPVAPLEAIFLLEASLRRRGVRDQFSLTYTYPINRVHPIAPVAEWAAQVFQERGIESETFCNVEQIDAQTKQVQTLEGNSIPYDLLIAIPEHRPAQFLEDSGLTYNGWVPVDRESLAVVGHDGIWALGDTTNLAIPKAGSVAHYQAYVVAKNVASRINKDIAPMHYDGKTLCFIETGDDKATYLEFDYNRLPVTTEPSRLLHWAKLGYNEIYWLTAKGVA